MEYPVGSWIVSRSLYSFGIARIIKETPQKLGIDGSVNLYGRSVFKNSVFCVVSTREAADQIWNDLKAAKAQYDAAMRALGEDHRKDIEDIRTAALSRAGA